jgi:hypothetical protein
VAAAAAAAMVAKMEATAAMVAKLEAAVEMAAVEKKRCALRQG